MISIAGTSGDAEIDGVPNQSDRLEGATGTLDTITTDKLALVKVTASIWNKWLYGVQSHGAFSSAEVKGGIDMAAYHDGQAIDGPRRLELFSDYTNDFNEVSHTGTGVANVDVNFTLFPGDTVGVPFGVWLICDHSSNLGSAGAGGSITAQVFRLTIVKIFM